MAARIPSALQRTSMRTMLRAVRWTHGMAYPKTPSAFATLDVDGKWDGSHPHTVTNLVAGQWTSTAATETIVDPLNGEAFLNVPLTSVRVLRAALQPFLQSCHKPPVQKAELKPFLNSLATANKTGLHNPFRNVERYLMLGRVSNLAAAALREAPILDYFTRLIMRTSPKSYAQAEGEVRICANFLDNFSGDNVRFLARSFGAPGDRDGQESRGYRFPYGPVALVVPFNFPLEIPVLQVMGALYMGNKPVLKVDSKVSVAMEQFMRLLHAVGLPAEDVDMVNTDGPTMNSFLVRAQPRMTLFTGSSRVAEKLARDLNGKIKIEDAGFDWKILGPDVKHFDYVAWTCDQDAYACSGQKCSAQSLLFVHRHWAKAGLYERLQELAARRKLSDLTVGPVLTWTTKAMLDHVTALLAIPGAKLLFGGKELEGGKHSIPSCYGAIEPTAVFIPLRRLAQPAYYKLATTEVFGPLQVVTEYRLRDMPVVLDVLERMDAHLTAAVVSNDDSFRQHVLSRTVNGTTYAGIRARTTGAPQNHWFGPSGDPRGAGIGTKEAIQLVWSSHREIIMDVNPVPSSWTVPDAT